MATHLVVEWTRATLRVAVTERRAGMSRLASIHSQPISAIAELPERLRQMVKTLKPTSTEAVVIIPREQVITRVVKFPSTQPTELAQMAELYARAQLPYPREQAVMDSTVLRQEHGFSVVAIIACQRDIIDRSITVLQEAGLTAGLLTVSSWGVLGWYRQAGPVGGAKEPALVVNIDETRTDLVLIADGRILSSRSVGQGLNDWGGSADTIELLAQEVERSRAAIQKEVASTDTQSLVLTGVGITGESGERLSQRIGLPVFVTEGRRAFPGLQTEGGSPVVVGGAAASPMRGLLDLNPPEVRARLRHREQVRDLARVSALLVGVLVMSSALLGLQVARRQKMARQLDQVIQDLAPTAKQAQEHSRAAQLVRTVLADRRRLAKTFAAVLRSTPSEVSLEVLTFERPRREVVVRGRAGSTQDVLAYIGRLEAVEGVAGVELKYSTRRATPLGDRTDFELVLRQRSGPPPDASGGERQQLHAHHDDHS